MFKIIDNQKFIEFEFNGIKIIQANNPTIIIKNFFDDNINIEINGLKISKDNIVHFNEITKFNEIIRLSKNSNVFKAIFNEMEEFPIINYENINRITEKINNEHFELLENSDGDLSKLILSFFQLLDLGYLDKEKFIFLIENFFNDKKYTFILENISWLNSNDLLEYINNHNFIILTNDFRNYINNITDLELLYISDDNLNGIDIIEKDSLINYLEKELNIILDNSLFNKFLNNKEDLEMEKIFFKIKTIKV